MVTLFHDHRSSFDELRAMLAEDSKLRVIRDDWLQPFGGAEEHPGDGLHTITENRWTEYRSKFRELGLAGGVSRASNSTCEVYFFKFGSGFSFSSRNKGYAYCDGVPSPLVASLDQDTIQSKTTTYRRLDGNWYLFLEFD